MGKSYISKVFGKVWRIYFLYKVEQTGNSVNILDTYDFLSFRKQRVV